MAIQPMRYSASGKIFDDFIEDANTSFNFFRSDALRDFSICFLTHGHEHIPHVSAAFRQIYQIGTAVTGVMFSEHQIKINLQNAALLSMYDQVLLLFFFCNSI